MSVIVTTTFVSSCLCLPCIFLFFPLFMCMFVLFLSCSCSVVSTLLLSMSATEMLTQLAFIPYGDLNGWSTWLARAAPSLGSWPSSRLSETWLLKTRRPGCGMMRPSCGSWRWRSKNSKNCLALPRQTRNQKGRTWGGQCSVKRFCRGSTDDSSFQQSPPKRSQRNHWICAGKCLPSQGIFLRVLCMWVWRLHRDDGFMWQKSELVNLIQDSSCKGNSLDCKPLFKSECSCVRSGVPHPGAFPVWWPWWIDCIVVAFSRCCDRCASLFQILNAAWY